MSVPSSSVIRLRGVGFAYPEGPPVLRDVDLDLGPGFTAVVGPNGAGKSTLLRLVAGELEPSAGSVRRPAGLRHAHCRQATAEPTDEVQAFAWDWNGGARRLRARLGLDPEALSRWATLSPGERQRWQIAATLDARPDLLLLDEPTNHLDTEARQALAAMLHEFTGVGLVVSHDRAFLDALAARTVWVEGGVAAAYAGGYAAAREQREASARGAALERRARQRELRRLEGELDLRRRRQASADRHISAATRIKGPRDSDAREAGRKGRALNASAALARGVGQLASRRDRAADAVAEVRARKERGRAIAFDAVAPAKAHPIRVALPPLRAGDRLLLEATAITVARTDRVRIAGANGAGKSTLLRRLAAAFAGPAERLLVLPQELGRDERRAALEALHAAPRDERGRTLSLVAALGVDPVRLLGTSEPSPGEARKLALAHGLAREVACALLDEPTNHLDAPSIERLEDALLAFGGALVLVTHDEALAAHVATSTWTLRDGRLEVG